MELPTEGGAQMDERKRLARRPEDGMIAGVAAGIAQTYGIDVTLVRLAFVAVAIVSAGFAVLAYFAAAIVMPRADEQIGTDSVKHNVDDLVTRGRELVGETRKVIDRARGQPVGAGAGAQSQDAGVRATDTTSHEF
jgi:phage shock protein PspC (stress-responsive transcriptional regulator)